MEATNISIKQASSVSINIETWLATWQGTLQAVKQAIKQRCKVGAWTLPRLYRKELKAARAISKTIDAHPTISNIIIWAMVMALMVEVFLYA